MLPYTCTFNEKTHWRVENPIGWAAPAGQVQLPIQLEIPLPVVNPLLHID